MNNLKLFLTQVEQLNGIIALINKLSKFEGKVLNKKQWAALFDTDETRATNLLNQYIAEAYILLASQFPTRAELKGEKGESIEGKRGFSIRGKKGKDGKDAPTLDELKAEMQKMVDKVEVPMPEVPAPIIQPAQVTEITKVVHEKIDFDVDIELTRSGKAIRDALELIDEEREKLAQSAVRGLPAKLKELDDRIRAVFAEVEKVGSQGSVFAGTTWEEAEQIARRVVTELAAGLQSTFESYRQNHNAYDVTATTDTDTKLTKTFDTPAGDIIYTLNFDLSGDPSTATLSGAGLPEGVGTTKTYDFTGRDIPLITYT